MAVIVFYGLLSIFLDAFFYVGATDNVQLQVTPYGKIPDENGVRYGIVSS